MRTYFIHQIFLSHKTLKNWIHQYWFYKYPSHNSAGASMIEALIWIYQNFREGFTIWCISTLLSLLILFISTQIRPHFISAYLWYMLISLFEVDDKIIPTLILIICDIHTIFFRFYGRFLAIEKSTTHWREYFSLNLEWLISFIDQWELNICILFISIMFSSWKWKIHSSISNHWKNERDLILTRSLLSYFHLFFSKNAAELLKHTSDINFYPILIFFIKNTDESSMLLHNFTQIYHHHRINDTRISKLQLNLSKTGMEIIWTDFFIWYIPK